MVPARIKQKRGLLDVEDESRADDLSPVMVEVEVQHPPPPSAHCCSRGLLFCWGEIVRGTSQTGSTLLMKRCRAQRPTYRVAAGEAAEQHLSRAHLVPHSSDGPVLAADVDPLLAEQLVSLGTRVQKQVIGFAAALVLGHPETGQVAVGFGGTRALWLRACAAALLRGCRARQRSTPGCFILEHLRQHPTAVGCCYSEPHCFSCLFFLLFPSWFLHCYTRFFFSHGSHWMSFVLL